MNTVTITIVSCPTAPVSTEVQKVVIAEKVAADQALEKIEDVQELVKQADDGPVQLAEPDPIPEYKSSVPAVADLKHAQKEEESEVAALQNLLGQKPSVPNFNYHLVGGIFGGLLLLGLFIWAA